MNEVRDDFHDFVKEHKTNINHFVPATAKHLTEKDFASRSGPVKTLVPPNLPTLQNRIRYCLRGDTMSAFAKKLGVAANTVYQWCSGIRTQRVNMMRKIAELGGVSVAWLMDGQTESVTEPPAADPPAEQTTAVAEEHKTQEKIAPAFALRLNGEYTGQDLAKILSGLLAEQKYTVTASVEA